jgi:hypothetical protein
MKSFHLYIGAALCTFLTSCAPYPHQVVRVPEIRGTLSNNGNLVSNAIVLIAQKGHECVGASVQGATNALGEFHIPETNGTEFFYSFLNPPDTIGQLTSLCFRVAGERATSRGKLSHRTSESVVVDVNCDIARPMCRVSSCQGDCRGVGFHP